MSVDEVVDIVASDEVFYRRGGGGMTLSGGEPLLQAEFAIELLKRVKSLGISTVMETCGFIPVETLLAAKPYVSLFLYDMKHPDEAEHRKYTGVSNEPILHNLKELTASGAVVVARMPLIPGVNDSEETVRQAVSILKCCGVGRLDLLPYHSLGKGKYESIGKKYTMEQTQPPSDGQMEQLRAVIREAGFLTGT
jgi:pyruvate formate lyase activating enzyme